MVVVVASLSFGILHVVVNRLRNRALSRVGFLLSSAFDEDVTLTMSFSELSDFQPLDQLSDPKRWMGVPSQRGILRPFKAASDFKTLGCMKRSRRRGSSQRDALRRSSYFGLARWGSVGSSRHQSSCFGACPERHAHTERYEVHTFCTRLTSRDCGR